tara:strand:+ start:83667 stop:84176 length:510 start_codon:yes stop_codon:yes gene_type:complete
MGATIIAQTGPKVPLGMNPTMSIAENTGNSDNHTFLLAAIKATDLEGLLDMEGPFTVFAPSDKAFEKLTPSKIDFLLMPENKKALRSLLTYHIVAGSISASKILSALCHGNGKTSFTTVQGTKITATMDGLDIILTDYLGNSAKIITADANQCNGVIHEIDGVILPQKI